MLPRKTNRRVTRQTFMVGRQTRFQGIRTISEAVLNQTDYTHPRPSSSASPTDGYLKEQGRQSSDGMVTGETQR